jgi:hypothetical protein
MSSHFVEIWVKSVQWEESSTSGQIIECLGQLWDKPVVLPVDVTVTRTYRKSSEMERSFSEDLYLSCRKGTNPRFQIHSVIQQHRILIRIFGVAAWEFMPGILYVIIWVPGSLISIIALTRLLYGPNMQTFTDRSWWEQSGRNYNRIVPFLLPKYTAGNFKWLSVEH